MKPIWLATALGSLSVAAARDADPQPGSVGDTGIAPPAEDGSTIFNNIRVPQMNDIEGSTFNQTVKNGYWWVEHYSPYCGHCKHVAPSWQTLYEFYYTMPPLEGRAQNTGSDANLPNTFEHYYNFHIAKLNCVAFGDVCAANDVMAYPSFLLFKDGEIVDRYEGGRSVAELSEYVEEKLESIRPGSRPAAGVRTPLVGENSVDRSALPVEDSAKDKEPEKGKEAGEKANSKIAITSTSMLASETARVSRPKTHAGPPPNPQGTSKSLNAESFQKLVTNSQEPWFIKFYAPWCSHCQHLAPTWSQLAREMTGQLNIGEVNCDDSPRLCKEARVSSYPTLYFFRGGERVEYDGLRGLGDLLSFTNKALDSDVKYVDAAAFRELEETEEVIFTYFFDHATTSEDFAALDRLTLSLIGHARIVKTDSDILATRFKIHSWPKLLVSRSGRPTYYTALAPKDMRDFRKVLSWMQSVWLPLVPELTAMNAREIMSGRFTVLGVLNRANPDEFKESRRELQNAAIEWMDKRTQLFQLERQELRDSKQLRIEEAKDRGDARAERQAKSVVISITEDTFKKPVSFAWVDGVFWERWLRSTYGLDVAHGERVIINDEDERRYWDMTETGNPITPSRVSILETLTKVTAEPPKLPSKSTIGFFEGVVFRTKSFWRHHPYLFCVGAAVVVGVLGYISAGGSYVQQMRRRGRGYFRVGEEKGLGILGGSSNGKAD